MGKIYTDIILMIKDMCDCKCYIFRDDEPKKLLAGFRTSGCNSWYIKVSDLRSVKQDIIDMYKIATLTDVLKIVNINKEIPEYDGSGINVKCNNCIIKNIIE